jgi:hypothetical protein
MREGELAEGALGKHRLVIHPAGMAPAVAEFSVEVSAHAGGGIRLAWRLDADRAALRIPDLRHPAPPDRLWAHTCCEVFIAEEGSDAYREFNFSPSGQWAAYGFAAYRQRAAGFALAGAPVISVRLDTRGLDLVALLGPKLLPDAGALQLALTGVVEDAAGGLSYWALRHPGQQPDFHDRRGFVLSLPRGVLA